MKRCSKAEIAQMYAEYNRPLSMSAVERLHGLGKGSLWSIFKRNGLKCRPCLANQGRTKNSQNQFVADPPLTPREIDAMVDKLKRIMIPAGLKNEWRGWLFPKRAQFIARLRKKFNSPFDRPETPFSRNVTPFEYGSERAHALAAKMNIGKDSRSWCIKIKPASQGVIWRGQLYFWTYKGMGYAIGPWREGIGRPLLHRLIWEHHNSSKVPDQTTVIFLDGNKNNLDPGNLALRTMAECALQNRSHFIKKEAADNLQKQIDKFNNQCK